MNSADSRLAIAIVGCGLGGLAVAHCLLNAGHRVKIFESKPVADEVGAGLQISPNITRLLWRWGLQTEMENVAVKPTAATWRRYDTGALVGLLSTNDIERENGVPFYNIHRGDLHRILRRKVESGAEIRTNAEVILVKPGMKNNLSSRDLEECRPSIVIAGGEEIHVDLVVGADGVKSITRQCLQEEYQYHANDVSSAYRAIVPAHELLKEPLLRGLVENPEVTCWMGPGRNVVGYCISSQREYNLVFAVGSAARNDGFFEDVWSAPADIYQLQQEYAQWEPRVKKLVELVGSTVKWKLVDRPMLHSWVHPTGNVVLIGDACHPTLPYGGQGAAMAIEDGAVLGNLLARVTNRFQVPSVLAIFESSRKGRCARTQESARRNEKIFHLADGTAQEARDAELGQTLLSCGDDKSTCERLGWAEKMKNQDQFGYDADAEAERWWQESQKGPFI